MYLSSKCPVRCHVQSVDRLNVKSKIALRMKSSVLLLTYVTPLISKPLDATSVAIKTRTRPVLKSSRACSRSHCSLRKIKHSTGMNHFKHRRNFF